MLCTTWDRVLSWLGGQAIRVTDLFPLFSVSVALYGLYVAIRHFKIVRTVSYIERMNSPAMVEIRASFDQLLQSNLTDEQKIQRLTTDQVLKSRYRIVYNLLTELAIAYRYRTINRRMAQSIWDPMIEEHWCKMEPVIRYWRANGSDYGYHLEYLRDELLRSRALRDRPARDRRMTKTTTKRRLRAEARARIWHRFRSR